MKRLLFLPVLGFALLVAPTVGAYGGTAAQLTILPKLCVVDVVQDGSNQTLQPSPGCEVALPNLLPMPESATAQGPLFALPFAGAADNSRLLQPRAEAAWTPIVSQEKAGPTTHPTSSLTFVASGLATAAVASAVGIDIALFEMYYSRSTGRWLHRQSLGRLFKG